MQRRERRASRNKASEEAGDVRGGEAAARDLLYCAGEPGDDDVLTGRDEFDEIAGPVEEGVGQKVIAARRDARPTGNMARGGPAFVKSTSARQAARRVGEVDGNDGREMAGPFAFHEILVVAGRDDVAAAEVSFVDPIFIQQDVVFAGAAKAAIQDVIAAFEGEADAFADDKRAGAKLFTQDAEAADFRIRSNAFDDAGDGGAVAEDIAAFAGDCREAKTVINDR